MVEHAKTYRTIAAIGKARNIVEFHDGVKSHRDGSKFFDIHICGNKRALAQFVAMLTRNGYTNA